MLFYFDLNLLCLNWHFSCVFNLVNLQFDLNLQFGLNLQFDFASLICSLILIWCHFNLLLNLLVNDVFNLLV